MFCKECDYFKYIGKTRSNSTNGSCQHPDIAFPLVSSENECKLTRSKLRCKDCDYWVEAEGFTREDDCGGCTYRGRYYPMFLNETCDLKDPWKTEVENKMSKAN